MCLKFKMFSCVDRDDMLNVVGDDLEFLKFGKFYNNGMKLVIYVW